MRVVLFVSSTQVLLYRLTGTQVWALPAKRTAEAINAEFDSSGEKVVVLYADGNYQIISVWRGRILTNGKAPPNFSWVGWSDEMLVWGTNSGEISVNLFGVLDTGLFSVGNEPVFATAKITEECKKLIFWVVAFNTQAVVLSANFSETDRNIVSLCAEMDKCAKKIQALGAKVDTERATFAKQMSHFMDGIEDPVSELYTVLLSGNASVGVIEWIRARHETGFKRWYKASSQSLDYAIEALTAMLPLAQQLIAGIGDLVPYGVGSESLNLAVKLLEVVVSIVGEYQTLQPKFESFATWLEVVFVDEIDRSIQATRKDVGDGYDAAEFIGMGLGFPKLSDDLSASCERLLSSFSLSEGQLRDTLKSKIQVVEHTTLGTSTTELVTEGNIVHLLTHDRHYVFGPKLISEEPCNEGSVLAGSPLQIAAPSVNSPFAVERRTGTMCILSNDCHHFTFENLGVA